MDNISYHQSNMEYDMLSICLSYIKSILSESVFLEVLLGKSSMQCFSEKMPFKFCQMYDFSLKTFFIFYFGSAF